MLIGEKQRSDLLRELVVSTIKDVLKIPFSFEIIQKYYEDYCLPIRQLLDRTHSYILLKYKKIVFTKDFMRLFAITMIALRYKENPCLVGEPGAGKT